MADKKLNEVSTASDGAYVYAEDSSGNQIKISKADLASVVAEQNINKETVKLQISANNPDAVNTGITKKGVYSLGIGSKDYDQPLFFVFSATVGLLNKTWYSNDVTFSIDDNVLYITYNRSTSTAVYITRICGV